MPACAVAKTRLDQILVARGFASTRARAQALILEGRVSSEGRRLDKPGMRYPDELSLEIREGRRFVSRGARKLIAAIQAFDVEVRGRDALDVGASTGGFTQALLEAGARRVIALDVGRGQLDWGLRNDPRVLPLEGLNVRYLKPGALPFSPRLAVIDVSFISLELVLPPVAACVGSTGDLIALVKPQFEVGRGQVGKGGIVRDSALHRRVLETVVRFAAAREWGVRGVIASPICGAAGNREFLMHIQPGGRGAEEPELAALLAAALAAGGGSGE